MTRRRMAPMSRKRTRSTNTTVVKKTTRRRKTKRSRKLAIGQKTTRI